MAKRRIARPRSVKSPQRTWTCVPKQPGIDALRADAQLTPRHATGDPGVTRRVSRHDHQRMIARELDPFRRNAGGFEDREIDINRFWSISTWSGMVQWTVIGASIGRVSVSNKRSRWPRPNGGTTSRACR